VKNSERSWARVVQEGSSRDLQQEVERLRERVKVLENVVLGKDKFSTACRYYQTGNCRRGATCLYQHGQAIKINSGSEQSSGIVSAATLAILAPKPETPASNNGSLASAQLQTKREGKEKEVKRQQQQSVIAHEVKLVIDCDEPEDEEEESKRVDSDEPDESVLAWKAREKAEQERAERAEEEDRKRGIEFGAEVEAFIEKREVVKAAKNTDAWDALAELHASFVLDLKRMRRLHSGSESCSGVCEFGCLKCLRGVPIDGTNGYAEVVFDRYERWW